MSVPTPRNPPWLPILFIISGAAAVVLNHPKAILGFMYFAVFVAVVRAMIYLAVKSHRSRKMRQPRGFEVIVPESKNTDHN